MKLFALILLLTLTACTTDEFVDGMFDCMFDSCEDDSDVDYNYQWSNRSAPPKHEAPKPCSGEGCGKPRV